MTNRDMTAQETNRSTASGRRNNVSASLRKLKTKLLRFQPATISHIEIISDHFRLISLSGDVVIDSEWKPGQKVEIALSQENYTLRTYTPLSWDRKTGVTQILVYIHGDAPGANWAAHLNTGETFSMSAPRDSVDLSTIDYPSLFFGDETSIGLAKTSLDQIRKGEEIRLILEVASLTESRQALERLGIHHAELIQKLPDNAHLAQAELLIKDIVPHTSPKNYIFTGNGDSIKRMTKLIKSFGISAAKFKVRPYWIQGRTGLD